MTQHYFLKKLLF